MKAIQFFMPMIPPTVTAQEHRIGKSKSGKMVTYDSPELKEARSKLTAYLAQHKPKEMVPDKVPLELHAVWLFPVKEPNRSGQYRITKPDTDNLDKLLKDCMTRVGFWKDDAQVAREIIEKMWSNQPGIFIKVSAIEQEER